MKTIFVLLTTSRCDTECRTKEGRIEREKKIVDATHAVMDEQFKQKIQGVNSPQQIALQYQLATEACQAQAIQYGLNDEIEAANHCEKATWKDCSRKESDDLTVQTATTSSICSSSSLLDDEDRRDRILSPCYESGSHKLVLPLVLGFDGLFE